MCVASACKAEHDAVPATALWSAEQCIAIVARCACPFSAALTLAVALLGHY